MLFLNIGNNNVLTFIERYSTIFILISLIFFIISIIQIVYGYQEKNKTGMVAGVFGLIIWIPWIYFFISAITIVLNIIVIYKKS